MRTLALSAVILLSSLAAKADFIPTINMAASNLPGGVFVYDINYATTINPTTGSNVQNALPGDYVTLYDIENISGATTTSAWSYSIQNTGVTPPLTLPADSVISNITLFYGGPVLSSDTAFVGALRLTSSTATFLEPRNYTSTDHRADGPLAGSEIDHISVTLVPTSVPEPGTMFGAGAGVLALGLKLKRRQRSS